MELDKQLSKTGENQRQKRSCKTAVKPGAGKPGCKTNQGIKMLVRI